MCYRTRMFRDRQTIASRVVLDDRSRLPWRFFGRLTTSALAPQGDGAFIVGTIPIDYIAAMVSKAQRIILADHTRLPWRFFGRLTAVQAGL